MLGGTFFIHYLKNFLLKEKISFALDWDGMLERLCITYILVTSLQLWLFIPLIIALKVLYRIAVLALVPGLGQTREPAAASQKVLLKSELALDLLLSPFFAILVGVILR